MKRKILWGIVAAVLLLAVLFVPIPTGVAKDGGTRTYTALTYKIVKWSRLTSAGLYENTRVYPFPDNFQTVDELWVEESLYAPTSFRATVVELNGDIALVEPVEGESERLSCDRISFSAEGLEKLGAKIGDIVEITYTGRIMESYPAQVHAIGCAIAGDQRPREFTEPWLNPEQTESFETGFFQDVTITRIYENCFFAQPVVPMPYEIKINGSLPAVWCPGDQILPECSNYRYDAKGQRAEADLISVKPSEFVIDPAMCYKPVIYLYPEEETEVSVKLSLNGSLTCTYPAYRDGWQVTALPDGTLTDATGKTYNYLYWEGQTLEQYPMDAGFCIKGSDTAAFLEDALAKLGLTRREANEFIVYWLPLMEPSPYNLISFQQEAYTNQAQLEITPTPDTLIRVFMTWQPVEREQSIPAQTLTAPNREGFTVVEWGGSRVG